MKPPLYNWFQLALWGGLLLIWLWGMAIGIIVGVYAL